MPRPIKLIVSPSPHYRQLKSGEIRYQKSMPTSPIWRILIIDEDRNLLHTRFYGKQPSPEDIEKVVMGIVAAEGLVEASVKIPATVERLCPGLQQKLVTEGVRVCQPAHGVDAGIRVCREVDDFFSSLETSMSQMRESVASCEELAAVVGNPLGVVTTTLWRDDDVGARKWNIVGEIAQNICRLRGRDPQVGREMRKSESVFGPLNRGSYVPPPQDRLSVLLRNGRDPYLQTLAFREILHLLENIRSANEEQRLPLYRALGATVVSRQIAVLRHGSQFFLPHLRFLLGDGELWSLVSRGTMEALKDLVVLDDGLLQVAAARVSIGYPDDCLHLQLRGVPAHHRLEKMIQLKSGGNIVIIPDLTSPKPTFPKFLESWGPSRWRWFHSGSQLSPARCVVPLSKTDSQTTEGLLIVIAILPNDTVTYLPIGDNGLASRMTALTNERLARNCKGVTCRIGPLQSYGEMMDIAYSYDDRGQGD